MEEFFKAIFQQSEGYLGLSFSKSGNWTNRYYNYPEQLPQVIAACKEADSKGWDCYFVPAILQRESRLGDSFKESNVAWVDYDKNEPVTWDIEPTVIVSTSDNRQHAYWSLEETLQDANKLEEINKALLLQHDGDGSGWDRTQLLRVPDTLSKKRNQPVVVTLLNDNKYGADSFPKLCSFPSREVDRISTMHY